MKSLVNRIRKMVSRFFTNQKEVWTHRILLFKPEHYPTLLSRDIKQRIQMLTSLKSIDEEQKSQIDLKLIKRYAKLLARLNFIEERWHSIRKLLYNMAFFGFILFIGNIYMSAGIINLFKLYNVHFDFTILSYIMEFAPVIITLLLYRIAFDILSGIVSFRQRLLLIGIVLLGGMFYLTFPWTRYQIYFFGLFGLQIIVFVSIGIDTLISLWFDRRINNWHPETIVVYNILLVMQKLDEGLLSNFYVKNMFVTRLEYAAYYFENHIFHRLRTPDNETNEWIQERTRQIASALRDKKKWIYTPKPDTSQYLMKSLANFLIHFLRNEWDLLERLDMPKTSRKGIWKEQALTFTRNLIFGLLPIGTLLLLQYTKIVSTPFSDSVIGVATIWAIINILWLDPSAKEKINAVKDATATFKS